jgi:hypothetical protein
MKIENERRGVVEYGVPLELRDYMKVSKIVAVELLDEILSQKFGIHFLEPIVVEKVV